MLVLWLVLVTDGPSGHRKQTEDLPEGFFDDPKMDAKVR